MEKPTPISAPQCSQVELNKRRAKELILAMMQQQVRNAVVKVTRGTI